jgi:cytidyltransferase-like protein
MGKINLIIAPILKLSQFREMKFLGKRVVLAGGAFDILHIGHIEHLKRAKAKGDILIVHITGDRRYFEKRGYYPLSTQIDRARIVASIRFVDYVFIYNKPHFNQKIVDIIKPDILFFNMESFRIVATKYIKNKFIFSGKVIVDKARKIRSSSIIRKRMDDARKKVA